MPVTDYICKNLAFPRNTLKNINAFNEKSWLYYTSWFWYLGWSEHRFELVNQGFALSELGTALKEPKVARWTNWYAHQGLSIR